VNRPEYESLINPAKSFIQPVEEDLLNPGGTFQDPKPLPDAANTILSRHGVFAASPRVRLLRRIAESKSQVQQENLAAEDAQLEVIMQDYQQSLTTHDSMMAKVEESLAAMAEAQAPKRELGKLSGDELLGMALAGLLGGDMGQISAHGIGRSEQRSDRQHQEASAEHQQYLAKHQMLYGHNMAQADIARQDMRTAKTQGMAISESRRAEGIRLGERAEDRARQEQEFGERSRQFWTSLQQSREQFGITQNNRREDSAWRRLQSAKTAGEITAGLAEMRRAVGPEVFDSLFPEDVQATIREDAAQRAVMDHNVEIDRVRRAMGDISGADLERLESSRGRILKQFGVDPGPVPTNSTLAARQFQQRFEEQRKQFNLTHNVAIQRLGLDGQKFRLDQDKFIQDKTEWATKVAQGDTEAAQKAKTKAISYLDDQLRNTRIKLNAMNERIRTEKSPSERRKLQGELRALEAHQFALRKDKDDLVGVTWEAPSQGSAPDATPSVGRPIATGTTSTGVKVTVTR
jgi:hypothetical protein